LAIELPINSQLDTPVHRLHLAEVGAATSCIGRGPGAKIVMNAVSEQNHYLLSFFFRSRQPMHLFTALR
jgi:hypothetical protein